MAKRIITETDILDVVAKGDKILSCSLSECIVTAQAQDKALELGVTLTENQASCAARTGAVPATSASRPALDSVNMDKLVLTVVERMKDVLPSGMDSAHVARLVRDAVAARMAGSEADTSVGGAVTAASGIIFVDGAKVLDTMGTPAIKEQALLAEAIGRPGESKLSAGYLVWEGMSFERFVEVPEIIIVLEGELHLKFDGRNTIAKPGDMAYLPQGVHVVLDAPARVKLACINTLA
jgi:ethanolamine utilization protein EutQ